MTGACARGLSCAWMDAELIFWAQAQEIWTSILMGLGLECRLRRGRDLKKPGNHLLSWLLVCDSLNQGPYPRRSVAKGPMLPCCVLHAGS